MIKVIEVERAFLELLLNPRLLKEVGDLSPAYHPNSMEVLSLAQRQRQDYLV
jgi:hypothetical protein